jgi:hypothetical protein
MSPFFRERRVAPQRQLALLRDYRDALFFAERCIGALDAIPPDAFESLSERRLVVCSDVQLIESRKGVRVTERSGYSTGRSYHGVRVGPLYVGGSSGSARTSRTISYPAPDELTLIDSGEVIVTTRTISFVGSQFTRTTAFGRLIDIERRGSQILLAPSNATKVHILGFESDEDAFLAAVLIMTAMERPNRRLEPASPQTGARRSATEVVATAHQLLADGLAARRQAVRDLLVEAARREGRTVVPLPIPAPSAPLRALMHDDPFVPFANVPKGTLTAATSPRRYDIALLLAVLGGGSGLDRFYLGYWREGFVKLFTAGGIGVLWVRDIRLLLAGDVSDAYGRPLDGAPY